VDGRRARAHRLADGSGSRRHGWAYSHTNYVVLGQLLTAITGKPVDAVLQQYVMDPMGLDRTGSNEDTPAMPEPVMHVYSSEQRGFLELPASTPFSVESTFWNPSWTTAKGAVQTTTCAT
jgi:CubicO group peptidase (beta-lactamase class C family)